MVVGVDLIEVVSSVPPFWSPPQREGSRTRARIIAAYMKDDENIMSRIHASTWVLVGHPTGVSHEPGRTVTHFRTTRVRVDRPASDEDFVEADCSHCGAVIEVRVLSARRTARRRLLWALLALAGLVASVCLAYLALREVGVVGTDPADTGPTLVEVASMFGFAIGFLAFVIGLVFAVGATGIRITNDPLGSGRHTLLKRSWSNADRVTGLP